MQRGFPIPSDTPFRKWAFTWFVTDEHPEPPAFDEVHMTYLIFQQEICPTTSRPHYQGYVSLKTPQRMTGVKRILRNSQVFLSRARDESAAIEYCRKRESRAPGTEPVEFGRLPRAPKSTSLQAVCHDLKHGADVREVALKYSDTFVKYHKGIVALQAQLVAPALVDRVVFVLHGPAGSGKTRHVYDAFPIDRIYTPLLPGHGVVWFDGYRPGFHKVVLFDDYDRQSRMLLSHHKFVTDRYIYNAPVKGGTVYIDAPIVIFTSNEAPQFWFGDLTDAHNDAISRRITKSWYVHALDSPVHPDISEAFAAACLSRIAPPVAAIPVPAVPVHGVPDDDAVSVDSISSGVESIQHGRAPSIDWEPPALLPHRHDVPFTIPSDDEE